MGLTGREAYHRAMLRHQNCRRYADECLQMSGVAQIPENRERLIEMAAIWRKLAAMADDQSFGSSAPSIDDGGMTPGRRT
jgi:hypothetical protein